MGRLIFCLLLISAACEAETRWYESRSGPIELLSDAPQRQTLATLGAAEQLRFALGRLLGIEDLQATPKVRLVIYKDSAEAAQSGALPVPVLQEGRDRRCILMTAGQPLAPETIRQLTRMFIERNTGRLPPEFERGLETFLTTLDVRGAHVLWGAPPPNPDREWARVALLATKPEFSGGVGVLLFNLQKGGSDLAAYHNAFNKTKAQIEADVDQYWAAKQFQTADAPSRPLNALRDFNIRQLDPDVAELEEADVLGPLSEAGYRKLIARKVRLAACYEGLALLALRKDDRAGAADFLRQAVDAGSQNAAILIRYAKLESDPEKSRKALEKAVQEEPTLAEAHHEYGLRLQGAAQIREYEAAAKLAPQNLGYLADLARAYLGAQQFNAAAKTWTLAEQAATNDADREQMIASRREIESQRLDREEAERKRKQEEERRDLERVKAEAIARIRAAERQANGALVDPEMAKNAVPWFGKDPDGKDAPLHVDGTLRQVDCLGTQLRLVIFTKEKKIVRLLIADLSNVEVKGEPVSFACGVQKPRAIKVEYFSKVNAKLATSGEVAAIDLPREK